GSIVTAKPESLPTAVTRSTITPWMVLVLVLRKVNGMPVGVDPTLSTGCACAGMNAKPTTAASVRKNLRMIMSASPSRSARACLARHRIISRRRQQGTGGAERLPALNLPAPLAIRAPPRQPARDARPGGSGAAGRGLKNHPRVADVLDFRHRRRHHRRDL